jgi:hypothetical protein
MFRTLKGAVLCGFLSLTLSGCALFQSLGLGTAQTVASAADPLVPPSVQAPIANSAAAAENLYTGSVKVLTAANNSHALTLDQVNQIDPLENKVYDAIVAVRDDIRDKKDVSAALALFNTAYGNLFSAAKADGVALPTTGGSQ